MKLKLIGFYTIITINEEYNTYRVQVKNSKQGGLYMNFLKIAKSQEYRNNSKFEIFKKTLKKSDAYFIDNIPSKSL